MYCNVKSNWGCITHKIQSLEYQLSYNKTYSNLGIGSFGEQDGVILPELLRSDRFDNPLRNDLCLVSLGDFHSFLLT